MTQSGHRRVPFLSTRGSWYDPQSEPRGTTAMKRREFLKAIAGLGIAWPCIAIAQQSALPIVGFLSGRSLKSDAHLVVAFRQGLGEAGYVEGRNVAIEFRWADDQFDLLPGMASSLAAAKISVLFAGAIDAQIKAIKSAIATTPAVFATGGDLVELGIVESINRPGGNITGVSLRASELWPKQLEVLRDLLGPEKTIGLLVNPNNVTAKIAVRDAQAAAKAIEQNIVIIDVRSVSELSSAFATLIQQRVGALLVTVDALFTNQREKIVSLASTHKVPTLYGRREFVEAGGLISYGANTNDQYRQSGVYVGRILSGAKPSNLPVQQPTKFELLINLKAANALGLTVPRTLLERADEIID
jgi:putative ABC transport system substrate-binding protein